MSNIIQEDELLKTIIQKGFHLTYYKEQDLYFYSLTIAKEQTIKKLFQDLYPTEILNEDDFTLSSFTIEIQTNFSHPQYCFNGLVYFDSFDDLDSFHQFIQTKLPDDIDVRS
ncbi:hypothetical protein [Metabacillus fastidiosus]|uniref:Uncharacterized protein n=1 Tax=Metabacillus fastidiosus TaxID=1458 RepID=A0ABU6P430_9BACI|nr:hypothetical protein [Metabacillus fastidiosus]